MERPVEIEDFDFASVGKLHCLGERDLDGAAAALHSKARAGVIHQDAAHHFGRYSDELGAVLPVFSSLASQTYPCLMHQRGRLQGVATLFPG